MTWAIDEKGYSQRGARALVGLHPRDLPPPSDVQSFFGPDRLGHG
ncbi:MAG: hypothetical protein QOD74_2112 [Variibacter sp.]|nr:hypothetical protein [Variibacter sp.]